MCVRSNSKLENSLFFLYFFNKDISVNIMTMFLTFSIHIYGSHIEGTVSRICYIGPSLYFMQSRKKSFKK